MNFNIEHIGIYLKDNAKLKAADGDALKSFVDQYPFSGLLQLIYCKYLQLNNDIKLEQQLEKCALVVNDRKRVYELLFQTQLQEQIAEQEVRVEAPIISTSEKPQIDTEKIIKETDPVLPADNASVQEKEELPLIVEEQNKEETKTLDELEKNILTEAVNASIQVDISEYEFDEEIEEEKTTKDSIEQNQENEADEERSFINWFDRPMVPEKKQQSSKNLIDDFLKDSNNKERIKKEVFSPTNMAKMSLVANNQFVTETLATIYAKQGQIEKAIEIYKQLSLKNPEKKTFFASRIRFLKEKQQHNK